MINHPAPGNEWLVPPCLELNICMYTRIYRIHMNTYFEVDYQFPIKKVSRIISYAIAQRMFLKHFHIKWEFRMMRFSLISADYEAFA